MSAGYLYLLSNPDMPGLIKIGYTEIDVSSRVNDLSSATGVPSKFVLHYWRLTPNPRIVEKMVHDELSLYRKSIQREFFNCSISIAIEAIEKNVSTQPVFYLSEETKAVLEAEKLAIEQKKSLATKSQTISSPKSHDASVVSYYKPFNQIISLTADQLKKLAEDKIVEEETAKKRTAEERIK